MPQTKRTFEKGATVDDSEDKQRPLEDSHFGSGDLNMTGNTPELSFTDFDYATLVDPADYCLSEDERFPD